MKLLPNIQSIETYYLTVNGNLTKASLLLDNTLEIWNELNRNFDLWKFDGQNWVFDSL